MRFKLKYNFFLSILAIMMGVGIFAQKTEPQHDSLLGIISTTESDTSRMSALLSLSKKLESSQIEDAIKYAQIAFEIAESVKDTENQAKASNQIGVCYFYKGDFAKAEIYIKKALENYQNLNNKKGIGNTLNNLGVLHYEQGELDKALEFYLQSLQPKEQINDQKGIAMTMNNIANIYKETKEKEKAIDFYLKSIAVKEKIEDLHGIAMSLNNIGLTYFNFNELDSAFYYYEKSLDIKYQIDDQYGIAMTLHNLGLLFEMKNSLYEAFKYYQQAWDIQEKIGDHYNAALTLGNMSNLQIKFKNFDKAIFYLNLSTLKAKQIRAKKLLAGLYLKLSETQIMAHDYHNAYESLKLHSVYKDSMMLEDSYKQLAVVKSEMEVKNAENAIALLQKEKEIIKLQSKKQEIYTYALIVITLLSLLLIAFLLYRNKERTKELALREQLNIAAKDGESYVMITDKDDQIVWINDYFSKLTGYKLVDIIGRKPSEVLRGSNTSEATAEYIEQMKTNNQSFSAEILNYTKEGEPIWMSFDVTIVKDDKGEISRYVAFGKDISKRKAAEDEIRKILS
jgi:PAS domain S-box-containing protein